MKFRGLTGRVIGFALGLALPGTAFAANENWVGGAGNFYTTPANWSPAAVPGSGDTAIFTNNGATTTVNGLVGTVGGFQINAGAPAFAFAAFDQFTFASTGIVNNSSNAATFSANIGVHTPISFNGGSAANTIFTITNTTNLVFNNSSDAGTSVINLSATSALVFNNNASAKSATVNATNSAVTFNNAATAAGATINVTTGASPLTFNDTSTASNATINATNGAVVTFNGNSTGAAAAASADTTSIIDLSASIGPNSDHKISIGSLAGDGNFFLGGNQVTIGGNNLSTTITGIVSDCGGGNDCGAFPLALPIAGGSLVKTGTGTLTLMGVNTYTGGTEIDSGVINISNDNNLGATSGAVMFNGGTLQLGAGVLFNPARGFVMGGSGGTIDTNGFNGAVFGNITGAGSLTKIGAGELDLNGINSYAGGTIVNAGVLELVSGASLNPAGNLTVNGGTFDLNGNTQTVGALSGTGGTLALDGGKLTTNSAASTTFAGVITGAANTSFTKTGSGKLLLTGVSTLTGPTAVNGGILSVNGSLAGSTISVNAGGTLGGTGTVGPTTIQSGGTLSPGNSIGTLHVAGNLNQLAGSTFFAEVSPSASDETIVSGAASLAGSVTASFQSGTYTGTRYTLINSAGPLTGTYASLTTLNLPVGFSASLSYDANDAYLVLKADANPQDGVIHASLRTALITDERLIRDAVLAHLSENDRGISVWGEGFTAYGEINDPTADLHHAHSGGIAGVDMGLGDGLRIGLAGAYTADKLSLPVKLSTASGTAGHVVAYADWTDDSWRLAAGAELGWGSNQVTRQSLTITETDADHQANRTAQIFGEAGYSINAMGGLFVPHADIVWVEASSGAFAESGPLAGLSGPGASDSLTYSVLGMRAILNAIMLGDVGIAPRFDLGWQHALSGMSPAQSVSVTSSGVGAVLLGVSPSTDAATLRVGVDIGLLPNASLSLGYDGLISDRERDHAVMARFNWNF